MDIEDQLPALENQLAGLSDQGSEFDQAITGLIAKRNEMEEELFHFKETVKEAQSESASASQGAADKESSEAKVARAERAFNRVLRNATGVRRERFKASNEENAKLVELAELSRQAKIEGKLKALKDKSSS